MNENDDRWHMTNLFQHLKQKQTIEYKWSVNASEEEIEAAARARPKSK